MDNSFIKLNTLLDKNDNLLKILVDYSSNNIDKSSEISNIFTLSEIILTQHQEIKHIIDYFELDSQ